MWARISCTCWSASAQRIRRSASAAMSSPCRMAASVFAPKPLSSLDLVRLRRPRGARRAWRPSVRGRAAPPASAPGRARGGWPARSRGSRPAALRASAASRFATSVAIFSARSLPMPSMSVSDRSGSATMSAADSARSWIVRAALRYARTRNGLAPWNSSRSAICVENGGDFGVGHGGGIRD